MNHEFKSSVEPNDATMLEICVNILVLEKLKSHLLLIIIYFPYIYIYIIYIIFFHKYLIVIDTRNTCNIFQNNS